MATITAAPALEGRNYHIPCVHYYRIDFTAQEISKGIKIGVLPEDALIIDISAYITTAITGKKIQVGTEKGKKEFGEAADGNVGHKSIKPANNVPFWTNQDEVPLYAKLDSETANGAGSLVVLYVI